MATRPDSSRRLEGAAAADTDGEDRLSTLPDELLHLVLSFLPAHEAVRTCVLSRRWRNLWRFAPVLRIRDDPTWDTADRFNKFVNNLLLLRDRLTLHELEIISNSCTDSDICLAKYADIWIRYALMCNVRVLRVLFENGCRSLFHVDIPLISEQLQCEQLNNRALDFSGCPALEDLKMRSCIISTDSKILSQSLKRLYIAGPVRTLYLTSLPALEELEMKFCLIQAHKIVSQSLKLLCVNLFYFMERTHISAPGLMFLQLTDIEGWTPLLDSMPLLITASVKLGTSSLCCDQYCKFRPGTCVHCDDVPAGSFKCVLLRGLSHALNLELAAEPRTVLTDMIPLYSLGSSVISFCDDVERTQVFVKHLYGTFSVQVDLKKDLDALRKEVEKRTKLFEHYFTYRQHVLEQGCALYSYGITKDSHIHVHHRLRGGGHRYLTLNDFFMKYEDNMLQSVRLPDGTTSVELTILGCRILSSWIHCFTHTFMSGKSWDGDFDLGSFLVVGDRVKILKVPKYDLDSKTKKNDCTQLVHMIRVFFVLNNEYPPYLPHLLNKLESLSGDHLLPEEQLALERHASLILSVNRISLLYQIKRKLESWHYSERQRFYYVLENCALPKNWMSTVEDLPLFRDMILWAGKNYINYEDSGRGAFFFIRNYGTHALSFSWIDLRVNNQLIAYQWFDCNNGVELMIPKHFDNFVADMIDVLIKGKFDILPELIACTALEFSESPFETQVSFSKTDSSSAKRRRKRRGSEIVSSSAKRRRSSSSNSKSKSSPRISKRK